MPDPTAPDPFAILAQPPQMDPQTMALMQQTVGQPSLAPQPVQGVSRLPGVAGMISNLVHPPTQVQVNPKTKMAEARPASRLDVFENFLGNFLNSLSQGMAGSGTGPGANIRGAGIAMQAPRQLAIQNQQLANQQQLTQAQAQEAQQRGQYYASQSGELAPMSPETAAAMGHPEWAGIPMKQVLSNLAKPSITNEGKTDVATINAKSRMSVEQMKAQLVAGQVSKIIPAQDESGNPVMRAINKYGKPIGDIDGALPPASYLPKTTSTQRVVQTSDGGYSIVPVSNTSSPVLPKQGAPSGGGASRIPASGPTARPIMGTNGQPLQSPKLRGQFETQYIKPANDVEKSYQMADMAYQEYKAANGNLPTGAQSMLELSSHLSTTFGNVKGSRITKDMIAHHLGARSISDDAQVAIQKLTNGDALSKGQWDAFHDLIGQSRMQSWKIAAKQAIRSGVNVDFIPADLQSNIQIHQAPGAKTPDVYFRPSQKLPWVKQ